MVPVDAYLCFRQPHIHGLQGVNEFFLLDCACQMTYHTEQQVWVRFENKEKYMPENG